MIDVAGEGDDHGFFPPSPVRAWRSSSRGSAPCMSSQMLPPADAGDHGGRELAHGGGEGVGGVAVASDADGSAREQAVGEGAAADLGFGLL